MGPFALMYDRNLETDETARSFASLRMTTKQMSS